MNKLTSTKNDECDPNDSMPVLAQVMAWHQLGTEPLTVPVLTKRFNATGHHQATMS